MAGDSEEDRGGEAESEGSVVGTHTHDVSSEEESATPCPSSPAPYDAGGRRFSRPTALPAPPDSLAIPVPEYSHTCRDTVLPIGMLPMQSHDGYLGCPHRTQVWGGGPPCYLCSVLDAPPKYRRREAKGWQRFREKLAELSHGTPTFPQSRISLGQEPPAAVFTISERGLSDTPCPAPAEEVPESLGASPEHRRPQERDNPAFDTQDSVESGGSCRAHSGGGSQLPSQSIAFGPVTGPFPSSLVNNVPLPPLFPPEISTEAVTPTLKCSRRMICQLIYSFLLATACSTIIINYNQPMFVIISVIFFLALFVFLPIIGILECLFRCKMERDFRQYVQSIMISNQIPVTSPVV